MQTHGHQKVGTVNVTPVGRSALGIRRKLQCLDRALGMSPFQLVGTAFNIDHARETRTLRQATVFLDGVGKPGEAEPGRQRERPTRPNRCAHRRGRPSEKTARNTKGKRKRIETHTEKC